MIFVTGDKHGSLRGLSNKRLPEGYKINDGDFLIIAGDFGLLWQDSPSKEELWWLK